MMISLVVVVVVQLCFKLTTTGTCEGNIHKIHKQTLKLYKMVNYLRGETM